MSNGNGHSWSKFSWRDWTSDKALHPCGLAAKGLWIEMLCIMHEGAPVGHLTLAGKAATVRQIAANAGCTEKEATKGLAELEAAGVFSRTADGTIFSRRMVKDTRAAEQARAWGKEGGNPSLNGKEPTPKNHQGGLTPPIRQTITPTLKAPLRGPVNFKNLEREKEERLSSFSSFKSPVSPPAREEAPSEAAVRAARQQSAAEVSAMPTQMAEAVRSAAGAMRNYALDGQRARQTINEQREDVATRTPPRSAYLSREQLQAARRQQLRVVA